MFLPTYYYIFMLCVLLQMFQESNTGKKWMWDWDQKTVNHPLLTLVSVSNALFMILADQHSISRPIAIRPTKIQGQKQKAFSAPHFVCAPNVQISCGEKSGQQLNVKSRSSQSHCCMRVLAKHLKYFINIQKRNFDFEQFSKTFLFLV